MDSMLGPATLQPANGQLTSHTLPTVCVIRGERPQVAPALCESNRLPVS
jgi:hypothetical protein